EGDNEAENPRAGPSADGVADISAEQMERAVGQIDVAHQPKDQRESAGDQEIEAAERDAVEDGVEEDLLPAEGLFKAGRPDRENEPEQRCDREDRQKCPCRVALDESGHVRNL